MKKLLLTVLFYTCYLSAQSIVAMEYFLDTEPGYGMGHAIPVTADSVILKEFTADLSSAGIGFHNLYIRAKTSDGRWSPPFYKPFYKSRIVSEASTTALIKAEYFLDSDPGKGMGFDIPLTQDSLLTSNFILDLSSVSTGFHNLYVRVKNVDGLWSTSFYKPFYKSRIRNDISTGTIIQAEYFLDTDPGHGAGISIPCPGDSVLTTDFMLDLSNISIGFHNLYVRTKNSEGKWSSVFYKPFYKSRIANDVSTGSIVKAEYFLDADPGFGLGNTIPVSSDSLLSKTFIVSLDNVSIGFHNLYIRVKNLEGKWSTAFYKPFYKSKIANEVSTENIVKAEYFLDSDPGYGAGHDIPVPPDSLVSKTFIVDLQGQSIGFHNLYVRVKNSDGKWSTVYYKPVYHYVSSTEGPNIAAIEYFFDTDPGYNFGSPVSIQPAPMVIKDFSASITQLTHGPHWLYIRGRNSDNKWSAVDSVLFLTPDSVRFSVALQNGWNMLSLPLKTFRMTAQAVFPNATTPAFMYENGYQAVDTLKNGKGYWLKFASAEVDTLWGNFTADTTIQLSAGWNMIGPYHHIVPTAQIASEPPGLVTSRYFGHKITYFLADTLLPGHGYWIRASQNGKLLLPVSTSLNAISARAATSYNADWCRVTVSDAAGMTGTVYLKDDESGLPQFDLPPTPPTDLFDIRFATNRDVEAFNGETGQDLITQGAVYPLTITVNKGELLVTDRINGKGINSVLRDGQSITIPQKMITSLHVRKLIKPARYMLAQNFPNPFNPATRLNYQIANAGRVTLKLYSALGKELAMLVDEIKEPGFYYYDLNMSGLASGVYIYELRCNEYTAVKKLLLLK